MSCKLLTPYEVKIPITFSKNLRLKGPLLSELAHGPRRGPGFSIIRRVDDENIMHWSRARTLHAGKGEKQMPRGTLREIEISGKCNWDLNSLPLITYCFEEHRVT
jgi:hypothetical protein